MKLIYLGIILAFVPVISFLLKYYLSSKSRELKLFRSHPTCFYDDWLFILLNFLWPYVVNASFAYVLLSFLLSVALYFVITRSWVDEHRKENKPIYNINIKSRKLSPAGFVGLAFFIFESTLLLSFIFSTVNSIFAYIECSVLILFLLAGIPSSIKIHGKLSKTDLAVTILCIFVIILKIIALNI